MPLNFTAAHSSRIKKPGGGTKNTPLPSPFSSHARRKTSQQRKNKTKKAGTKEESDDEDRLEDRGHVSTLANESTFRDVTHAVEHIRAIMFSALPERAGMNSTRISEVLNYQKSLPPIVSLSHVHAVVGGSRQTERQISEAIDAGVLRRVVVPFKGSGVAGIGEGLVLSRDWEDRVREDSNLEDDVKDRLSSNLKSSPKATTLPGHLFSASDASSLIQAGYVTSWSETHTSAHLHATMKASDFRKISQAPSGSAAAVGGESLVLDSKGGGGGMADRSNQQQRDGQYHGGLLLCLPNTGSHLHLLTAARSHLVSLLSKSKYREAPLYLLRERWDGSVDNETGSSKAKRLRGETVGVLPGKTKKWKVLYGLSFEWALGECLGAGLVEVFETGSVGRGVRTL